METVLPGLWPSHISVLARYQRVHQLPIVAQFLGISDGNASVIIHAPPHVVFTTLLATLDEVPQDRQADRRAMRSLAHLAYEVFDAQPKMVKRAAQLEADQNWAKALDVAYDRPVTTGFVGFRAEFLSVRRRRFEMPECYIPPEYVDIEALMKE